MNKVTKTVTGIVSSASALAMSSSSVLAETITKPRWAIGGDGDGKSQLGNIISNVLNIVFAVGVILALFYLIWGAFTWITSGGDKAKTADARNKIIASVVGLILLAATWAFLNLVLTVIYGSGTSIDTVINDNLQL
ncbi:hypothetical protein FWH30_01325 [Microgenomates group bacterium]|nr:hypothetical protein [Microgenomates group bacterium]